MTTFDRIRYAIALLLLVMGPGAVLFWFPVHPLAGFWRRVGAGWGYLAGSVALFGSAVVLAIFRRPLLAVDFGSNPVTTVAGIILAAGGFVLRWQWRRELTLKTLFGASELAPARHPGELLQDGIYARVRHPRYLEVLVGFLGYALVSNYLASYLVELFLLVGILILIPFEERELAARFGPAYEDYRRRVPALIPRWK